MRSCAECRRLQCCWPTSCLGDNPVHKRTPPDMTICRNPEHFPPTLRVYGPGRHIHRCPSCGETTRFMIRPEMAQAETEARKSEKLILFLLRNPAT